MIRRVVRLPSSGPLFLDLRSFGRAYPFTPAQIEQIRRTVQYVPEVMVKVTGGGTKVGAVVAHLAYIGRKGDLTIETDDGQHARGREAQKAILKGWHLELTAGQYRAPRDGGKITRRTKLVHNIVLSMPSPTPTDKVLAAARKFAREKFRLQHRYAMVLHTDQQHPHVHLVVKAESEHGQRLHINKEMLREWREDFAQMMREQGIAANATSRSTRGKSKATTKDGVYRAQRRGASHVVRHRIKDIVNDLQSTRSVHDPARGRLIETRKAIVAAWAQTAEQLETQGEVVLAGEVRHFARHLPPVMTDKEHIAARFLEHIRAQHRQSPAVGNNARRRDYERTR